MAERVWHKHYDSGVPAEIDFDDQTVVDYFQDAVASCEDRTALIFVNGRLRYWELKDEVDRLATALASMGVGRGSRVAIQLPNLPQTVIGYYAVLRLGAHAVPTNPLYVGGEIEHQWNDAKCKAAIVADFLFESRVKAIRDKVPVENYIVASVPEYLRFPLNLLAPIKLRRARPPMIARVEPGPGISFFRRLVRETPPTHPTVELDLDDAAVLLYTGGTTGVSKGAMLSHRNISSNVQQLRAWFPQLEHGTEVQLAALPFFHSFGMTVAMNFPISIGATLVLIPNPRDIGNVVRSMEKHHATLAPAVPAMFNAINQYPGIDKVDLSSIKICNSGSAPLPVQVLERFEELTGGKIVEGYGLTETSPVAHCNPLAGLRKVGSIGVPLPNTDAKIVGVEDGTSEMPVGQEGELILRGPQVMQGYANMPEETANALRDGWLYTGDLATMDEDGYFRIVGRKKDMIVVSGFKVFPDEVDDALMGHPAVLEAATIGIPDEKRGETVKTFVVLKPGATATAEELIAYSREKLAAYKIPRAIEFREDLPKSTVLKVLRRQLRDEEVRRASA